LTFDLKLNKRAGYLIDIFYELIDGCESVVHLFNIVRSSLQIQAMRPLLLNRRLQVADALLLFIQSSLLRREQLARLRLLTRAQASSREFSKRR
jgi:hypothetical protein